MSNQKVLLAAVALMAVSHDGVVFGPGQDAGDKLSLSPAQAKSLVDAGVIRLVEEDEAPKEQVRLAVALRAALVDAAAAKDAAQRQELIDAEAEEVKRLADEADAAAALAAEQKASEERRAAEEKTVADAVSAQAAALKVVAKKK